MRIGQKAIFWIIDQLGFLLLFDLLGQQTELFLNLIIGMIIQIRNARLNIEDGSDRIHRVFARRIFVINEGFRKIGVSIACWATLHVGVS